MDSLIQQYYSDPNISNNYTFEEFIQLQSMQQPSQGISSIDLSGLPMNMGVANEPDVEQVKYLGSKPSGGISDLFQTLLGFAIPGYGLLKNMAGGGLESLRGLNQRIQQSDFAQSPTLMDYFDARSYGGRDARDRAAEQTMREARAIQKQMDMRPSSKGDISIDRGRGISQELRDTRQRDLTGGPGKDYGPFSR